MSKFTEAWIILGSAICGAILGVMLGLEVSAPSEMSTIGLVVLYGLYCFFMGTAGLATFVLLALMFCNSIKSLGKRP